MLSSESERRSGKSNPKRPCLFWLLFLGRWSVDQKDGANRFSGRERDQINIAFGFIFVAYTVNRQVFATKMKPKAIFIWSRSRPEKRFAPSF